MSVLVLRALGIGDLATAVPALRGLRAARPTEEIVLAAPEWLAPLAHLTGAVDRIVPVAGLDVSGIPVPPPRLAVNLHGKGPRSHRLLDGTRPERMLAFACPEAGFHDGPQWTADEHEVHRWCRMLDRYGIVACPSDLLLHPPAIPPVASGVTIVHPGAKDPARRWPPGRFARVAEELERAGHHVVVTGSPAERWLAARVAGLAGLPAHRVLAGRTDVGGLAALVAHAELVVCGDTGIGHLATGYGTPSVLLFGPTPPAWWGPLIERDRHRVLWHGSRVAPGRPSPRSPSTRCWPPSRTCGSTRPRRSDLAGKPTGWPARRTVVTASLMTRTGGDVSMIDVGVGRSADEAGWTADEAVTRLFSAHYRQLVRLAALLLADRAVAEELVQDAYVQLHQRWGKLRDPHKALGYLRTSVVNGARSAQRRRGVADRYAAGQPPLASAPSAELGALGALGRAEVVAALRALPLRQREVLVLRYYLDLSESDIADTMGISRGAVKSHASRGLAALRTTLEAVDQ